MPSCVVVFVVGGITFEETKAVAMYNSMYADLPIVIGGTNVHNFRSFCEEVNHWASSATPATTPTPATAPTTPSTTTATAS
eukprot:m.700482 g.700482  ORF g.700482 m.700482 type:complete len:81 (+) comp58706_c0_seq1:262-504(+)